MKCKECNDTLCKYRTSDAEKECVYDAMEEVPVSVEETDQELEHASDEYGKNLVKERSQYKNYPLGRQMTLVIFDIYDVMSAFEEGAKWQKERGKDGND